MNWDQISGSWNEFKGKAKQQWGRLTDDDLDRIAGTRDQLLGTLQRLYGKSREVIEREVKEFETKLFGDRQADGLSDRVGAVADKAEMFEDTDFADDQPDDLESYRGDQADGTEHRSTPRHVSRDEEARE